MASTSRSAAFRRQAAFVDSLENRLLFAFELIGNGSFANHATDWTVTGNFAANARFQTHRSGPGYAYLAGSTGALASSDNLVGTLKQTIAIPATVTSANLSFWYRTATSDGTPQADSLAVRIRNTSGTLLTTLTTLYNQTHNAYVQSPVFNLANYIGQSIVLSFEGQTNGVAGTGTVFRIDDVSLQANSSSQATVAAPVLATPGVPTNQGTLPVVNIPTPTLRWNAVAGAVGYGIKVERLNASNGYDVVYDSETTQYFSGRPIRTTAFTIPQALTAGSYRWSVRAFQDSVTAGAYAPPLHFTLATSGYTYARGVDISHWQGGVNWSAIKAEGISFAWVKATEHTSYIDDYYNINMAGARAAGVAIGGYHFARPDLSSGLAQANHFTSVLAGELLVGNLRPVLDMENNGGLTPTALSLWVNEFCERVFTVTGLVPLIYTGQSFAADNLNGSQLRYPLWMAKYVSTALPVPANFTGGNTPWTTFQFWQHSQSGSVGGVTPIDRDVFYGDVAALDGFRIHSTVPGTITGTLFNDVNLSGTKDAGELGIAGQVVFLDADGDGLHSAAEASTTTDANGIYSFAGLPSGTYRVRQVLPAGYNATTASLHTVQLAANQTLTAHFGIRSTDVTPPEMVAQFHFDRSPTTISLVFSEDIGTTLANTDIVIVERVSNAYIETTMVYDPQTRTATFTPAAPIPDGNYRLTMAASRVTDLASNGNGAFVYDFFALLADVDRDGTVGFDDLLVVSQNYGIPDRTFADGDITLDGQVNFDDLLLLSQSYGNAAIKLAAPTVLASTTRRRSR